MGDKLTTGDVILINLPSHYPRGHEQEGYRPAIVGAIPEGSMRYPVVIVVPLTTQYGLWVERNQVLYHYLPAGTAGLTQNSVALVDQLRAVDVRRVAAYLGTLEERLFKPIQASLIGLFS